MSEKKKGLAEKLLAHTVHVRYMEDLAQEYKQQKLERNHYAKVIHRRFRKGRGDGGGGGAGDNGGGVGGSGGEMIHGWMTLENQKT